MIDRLAAAAVMAVIATATGVLGASLLLTPTPNAAAPCAAVFNEADATDTSLPGLSQPQRSWGIPGGAPREVGPGGIATFAAEPPDNDPGTLILLDPQTRARCPLVAFASNHPIRGPGATSVEWSPSGDALALGLEGDDAADGSGQEDGVVLIWTYNRLFRVWSGEGAPQVEWSPDGRSLAVWEAYNGPAAGLVILHSDGSPDTTFGVRPLFDGVRWSKDGSRIMVSEAIEDDIAPDTVVSLVEVADGRVTPLDLDPGHHFALGWVNDDVVILGTSERGVGTTYLELPVSNPDAVRVLPALVEVPYRPILSPDGGRLAYIAGVATVDGRDVGDLTVLDLAGEAGIPVAIAPGRKVGPTGLAWSPDGSDLLFTSWEGELWAVRVDGTNLRQVVPGGLVAIDDSWRPIPIR